LLGDSLYNINFSNSDTFIERQALHSYKMEFVHPIYKKDICLEAEIPFDMKRNIY